MPLSKQVKQVEIKAHQGEYGRWRRDFCRAYRDTSARIGREASDELRACLESTGNKITCKKGCAYCCTQYISISMAHGLVIVDYLYGNPEKLESFLKQYVKWSRALSGEPALQELEKCTTNSYRVKRTPQELLDRYAELEIPCPFLAADACTIYPVRPICCASHLSVSPPAWCRAKSENLAMVCEAVPSQEGLRELAMLGEPELSLHQETMPSLIARLLTEGFPEVIRELQLMGGREGSLK